MPFWNLRRCGSSRQSAIVGFFPQRKPPFSSIICEKNFANFGSESFTHPSRISAIFAFPTSVLRNSASCPYLSGYRVMEKQGSQSLAISSTKPIASSTFRYSGPFCGYRAPSPKLLPT
ncbi:hypothetical protein DIPPA_31394 [Diplonema papillatum]|nr:hypothetical protein DIPPA_31394 [Diplonema papillatum]